MGASRRLPVGIATLLVLLLAVSSCGYGSGGGGRETTVTGGTAEVMIKDFAFDPTDLTVTRGTRVTWTNKDSAPHTVTADGKAFESGNLSGGQSFSFTFETAGTFTYHCSIHDHMKGKVTVK